MIAATKTPIAMHVQIVDFRVLKSGLSDPSNINKLATANPVNAIISHRI